MREYVCKPPAGNTRLYCTMIRRTDRSYRPAHTTGGNSGGSLHHNQENHLANGELLDGGSSSSNEDGTAAVDPPAADNAPHESGVAFTLYLEFLGGLIPLLKVWLYFAQFCQKLNDVTIRVSLQGKPTSRLRPDFIICDPYHQPDAKNNKLTKGASSATLPGSPKPSSTSRFGQFLSPAVQRKFRRNHNNNNHFIKFVVCSSLHLNGSISSFIFFFRTKGKEFSLWRELGNSSPTRMKRTRAASRRHDSGGANS